MISELGEWEKTDRMRCSCRTVYGDVSDAKHGVHLVRLQGCRGASRSVTRLAQLLGSLGVLRRDINVFTRTRGLEKRREGRRRT